MVHIPSNMQHSYYYEMKTHCDRAFMIKPDGSIHDLHGIIINKMCNCRQGVEIRVHAVPAEVEGQKKLRFDEKKIKGKEKVEV